MKIELCHAEVLLAVLGAVGVLFAAGCESESSSSTINGDAIEEFLTKANPAATNGAASTATNAAETAATTPASTNTTNAVLNDDPNCELVLKYQGQNIPNEGQVHYLNRVLTSSPFAGANPVCVQYNDAQLGEVTVWKDLSSTGPHVDVLPSDRVITKIVVWYD